MNLAPRWLWPCLLASCLTIHATDAPRAEITAGSLPGSLRAQVYLPDATNGFYRGTRFDWSGVIGSLTYAGHEYFPAWFQRTDASVPDFIYDGPDIVAGPCTAITGPAEEFSTDGKALGFDEAKAGGVFLKIGVGVLRRPDDKGYDAYRLYPIVDGGRWTVERQRDGVEFVQTIADPGNGYAYEYRKRVSVAADGRRLILAHRLRNTGQRVLQSSVYNHNFLFVDRRAPDAGASLTVPFNVRPVGEVDSALVEIRDRQIRLKRALSGEDRVYLAIAGFGADPADYDLRIENRSAGAGVRITSDRPLSRLALWAIRAPFSVEPFIQMAIAPGNDFTWELTYEFFSVPASVGL